MKICLSILFVCAVMGMHAQTPEDNLAARGIILPEIPFPIANYVNVVRTGNLLFLSGKGPQQKEGKYITGKPGIDLTIDQGYAAARLTGIIQIAVLKKELGSLSKVKRIVKVLGMVNSDSSFTQHPKVINGFSDLMVDIFGEKGRQVRSAVDMSSLPIRNDCRS